MTQMSDKLSNKAENSFLYTSAKPHRILPSLQIGETYDGVTHTWFVSHPVILLVK